MEELDFGCVEVRLFCLVKVVKVRKKEDNDAIRVDDDAIKKRRNHPRF